MMQDPKVTVIAEIGINHNGDLARALQMVDAAKLAGVSIVKFQHYDALKLLGAANPYLDYATLCQFTKSEHETVKAYCDSVGMEYLVSVFDVNDIPWADTLCKRHKVASRMNQDKVFIETLRATGKEVIISTQQAFARPMNNVRYMFCITKYPTPASELEALPCNTELGLSSHCPDIKPTLTAIAQGATVVEHHVTFSRDDEGCDHPSSITFDELRQLNMWANQIEVV